MTSSKQSPDHEHKYRGWPDGVRCRDDGCDYFEPKQTPNHIPIYSEREHQLARVQSTSNPSHDVLREQVAGIVNMTRQGAICDVTDEEWTTDKCLDGDVAVNRLMSLIDAHTEEKVREALDEMYQGLSSEASIYYEQGHTFDYEKAMKAYVTNKGKGDNDE